MERIFSSSADFQLAAPARLTSALSPQTWCFGLNWLPPSTYLVGGNVRDALLERHADYLDLDFVMPEGAVQVARAIASHYRAGFVLLDVERQIARVVFAKATADFAQQVGHSLEEDLERRDFTVNAIAYSPHREDLIDPLQGYRDLQHRTIRMVMPENLKEDPLRLLRAYRQAAQLSFTLDAQTQKTIQQLANLLQGVAAERVQAELGYLLSTDRGTPLLRLAWEDGLLDYWLPSATAAGLQQVSYVDAATIALQSKGLALDGWVRDQQKTSGTGRSWLKVAKLACLVSPDLAIAEQELWRLKYSRTEVMAVLSVLQLLPKLGFAPLSVLEQYRLFQTIGSAFPALAVVALANQVPLPTIASLVERFLDPGDPVAHPCPPLTGRDLMTELQLPPGPQIGQLLSAIQLAHAEGQLKTRQEALEFARLWLSA